MNDPVRTADDLWKRLVEHQPAVVAALALRVRELPADRSLRELGVARPDSALALPSSGPEERVEVEPYDTDWESCGACARTGDVCRYRRCCPPVTRRCTSP
ncbi:MULTISPECIES: hypothetical protein [unclassified Streptomyces]|uniref:hypothetical protein n=1 Tax=unclassified Streptomyces TaxID=2593676 RepID=UPI002E31338C|nr:hypothetical protein [Streptomyces sp. NBC_01268]